MNGHTLPAYGNTAFVNGLTSEVLCSTHAKQMCKHTAMTVLDQQLCSHAPINSTIAYL